MPAGKLIYKDRWFIWIGVPENRQLPRAAGFRYMGAPYFYWQTQEWEKACVLVAYADDECRTLLQQQMGFKPLNIEASRATDADIDIPSPDGLEYMGFQKAGIAFANERDNTLIADEMGLGKTIQALGFINVNPEIEQVLIVCPASVKINWRREANRWLVRDFGVLIVDGYFPQGLGPTIRILNYDQLHKYAKVFERTVFDLLICDEAHYGKNENSRRSKVMHAIQAKRTLYLTGSPIPNRPKELWPLIKRLDPERWTDRAWGEYRDKYCYANPETTAGARALANLQQILRSSVMVRRLKKDVLKDLPAKRRQVIELPASGEAAAAVRAEQAAVQQFTQQMVELKANVELMKASEDPADYIAAVKALREGAGAWFGAISKLRHDTAVAKLPQVKQEIDAALDGGQKVVVFAHHHDVINSLMESFGGAVKLDGTMPQSARQASVDAFQNDPATRLFVGSIQAAGVGLTLTASAHVIFAELDWVPGNMTQAEDRTHRIGQLNSVLVQHLVLEESLDATMAKKLVEKQLVIDAALDNEAGAEIADQPLVPLEDDYALEGVTRAQVERDAEILSPQEVNAVHEALRILAANCDGARARDGAGFNMVDAAIGRKLAEHGWLSRRQAALGRRIVRKYHGQIPRELMEVIGETPAKVVREKVPA